MKECVVCKRVFGDHVEKCDRDYSPLRITLPIFPIINSYRLDQRIGSGSLAIVYKGAKIGQNTPLAIKVFHPEFLQADPEIANVILAEAQAMAKAQNTNIVQILDYGLSNNTLYIVMEYLEGCLLSTLIEQEPNLTLETVYNLMYQICAAVAVMHKNNKLHHDLKPNNIFIVYDQNGKERIKVLDFGFAKIKNQELYNFLPGSRTQNLFSLPFYLSPEECDGLEITKLSEIYSLGVIFYQLLTGRVPFFATSAQELMNQHIKQSPIPLRSIRRDIPEAVESLVLRALAKSPEDRFSSVLSMINLIKMIIDKPRTGQMESLSEILPTITGPTPQVEEFDYHDYDNSPSTSPKPSASPMLMPKAPQFSLPIPNNISSSFSYSTSNNTMPKASKLDPVAERSINISKFPPSAVAEKNPKLASMAKVLVEALRISQFLSSSDLNPQKIVSQLGKELETKAVFKDGIWLAPNLMKIYVPHTSTKKFQEMESIFNSIAFISNIYKYVREAGYRFFSAIKLELEIVHPQASGYEGCSLELIWPTGSDISNGLEKIIQVDSHKIVKTHLPAVQISTLALLQPINGTTYTNYHLVIKPTTYLGRFRNVVDLQTSQLLRRNDISFLQPNHPTSPNTTISRKHAKIEFTNGNFYLYDTGSTNGTKINRRENNTRTQIPLTPYGQGVLLKNQDIIQLGSALLSFELIPSHKASDMIDKLSAELENNHDQLGSTAEAFRTMVASSSSGAAIVW